MKENGKWIWERRMEEEVIERERGERGLKGKGKEEEEEKDGVERKIKHRKNR